MAAPETCRGGFSLLELMIVLAILVSLAAITLPNLQRRFQRNELQEAGRLLQESLGELRQEALKSGRPLFVQFGWDSNRIRVFRDASYLAVLPRASGDLQSSPSMRTGSLGAEGFPLDRTGGLNPLGEGLDGSGLSLEPWDVTGLSLETDARFVPRRLTIDSAGVMPAGTGASGRERDMPVDAEADLNSSQSTESSTSEVGGAGTGDQELGPSPSGWSPPLAVLPDGSVQPINLWLHLDRQWQCPILWRGATGQLEIGPAQRVTEAAPASPTQVML